MSLPGPWNEYLNHLPILRDVSHAELLRSWGFSEVMRLRFADGSTAIAKRVRGDAINELSIYRELLGPFGGRMAHFEFDGTAVKVIVLKNAGHNAWIDQPLRFHEIMDDALAG